MVPGSSSFRYISLNLSIVVYILTPKLKYKHELFIFRKMYIFYFIITELAKKQKFNILWYFLTFKLLSLIIFYINSPYVQTTNGKISPHKNVQTKPVVLDMLIKMKYEEALSLPISFLLTSFIAFPSVFIGAIRI